MKKLLVIEDDELLQKAIIHKLKDDYDVISAYDGQEGLDKALAEKPDIILLDLLMPKMHGTEVLAKIREDDPWGKHVPVVVLTNSDSTDTINEVLKSQHVDYLVKADVMLEDIKKLVDERLSQNTI